MPEIDPVILQLIVNDREYRPTLVSLNKLNERAMGSVTRLAATVDRSMGVVKGALASVSVVALAQTFLSISDEAKKLDAQLRLATQGFGSFGQAQQDVLRIANDTRSGLSETASLYGNFVRGAKEMGASQGEAARATETFSKTLKISGADANQAASATLQFGQALAAGALRGDELNSILEASPRLARLLAESMGQPIGQIKKLGEEGKLTSDKLLRALTDQKFTAGIDAEFRQMPVTFDEAMTKVYNAAIVTFGAFDRGGEFSTALANFVTDGADGFADLERSAENFGIATRSVLAGLSDAFDPLLQAGLSVFEQLGGGAFDLQQFIRTTLMEADALLNIGPSVANFFGAKGKYDSRLLERYDATQKREQSRLKGQADQRRFDAQMSRYDVFGNLKAGNPGAAPVAARASSPASSGGGRRKTAAPKSKLDPESFAREESSLNDRILALKADAVVDITKQAQLESDRIEAARASAQAEIKADEKYTAEQKIKLAALTDMVASLQKASVVADRDKRLAEQVAEARAGNLRYERDAMEATAQASGTREGRLAAERRLLALMEQQERAELEAAIAAGKIADAQKARADLATSQSARRGATERDLESPLTAYARSLNESDIGDLTEKYAVQELEYVRDSLRDAITKKLGIKDPFLAGIIDMFIQEAVIKPLANAMSQASGSGGGAGGFIASLGTAIFGRASGGYVAPGQFVRVNEAASPGRVEGFQPTGSGHIIPLGRMNATPSNNSTQVVTVVVQEGDLFKAKVAGISRQVAGPIAQSAAIQAAGAMGKAINANIPNRISQFQRDGV